MEDHRVQTPQKSLHANRRSKATPERSNPKHQKSHRKSLNRVFLPAFEDVASESPKDSFDISSPLSEVSEEYQATESPQSHRKSLNPVFLPAFEDVASESPKDSFDISSPLSEVSEEYQATESPQSHRKSLNPVFLPAFEDVASESPKDSFDISSPLSEVFEEYQATESPQSFTPSSSSLETPPSSGITLYSSSISSEATEHCDSSVNQCGSLQPDYKEADSIEAELQRFIITPLSSVTSPSLETPFSSDMTLFSSTNYSDSAKPGDLSVNWCGSLQPNPEEADFFDVELLIKHLKQSMIPILNSDVMDYKYKKLHDALVKIVIEEFYRMPQERDGSAKLSSRKYQVMFLIFMLWLLAIMLLYFMNGGVRRSFDGPLPT